MPKAMNLTYGDFIMLEIALVHYMQGLDLSMMSGQYVSELIGKLEYELSNIKQAAQTQLEPDNTDAPPINLANR